MSSQFLLQSQNDAKICGCCVAVQYGIIQLSRAQGIVSLYTAPYRSVPQCTLVYLFKMMKKNICDYIVAVRFHTVKQGTLYHIFIYRTGTVTYTISFQNNADKCVVVVLVIQWYFSVQTVTVDKQSLKRGIMTGPTFRGISIITSRFFISTFWVIHQVGSKREFLVE